MKYLKTVFVLTAPNLILQVEQLFKFFPVVRGAGGGGCLKITTPKYSESPTSQDIFYETSFEKFNFQFVSSTSPWFL